MTHPGALTQHICDRPLLCAYDCRTCTQHGHGELLIVISSMQRHSLPPAVLPSPWLLLLTAYHLCACFLCMLLCVDTVFARDACIWPGCQDSTFTLQLLNFCTSATLFFRAWRCRCHTREEMAVECRTSSAAVAAPHLCSISYRQPLSIHIHSDASDTALMLLQVPHA
jgi:hypothetical protein